MFKKWKMNREIGMGMDEYICICEYENILVLVYRYSGIDIGIVRKRQRYIDRKGLIQGRGWEWVWGYRYGIIDYKREALA